MQSRILGYSSCILRGMAQTQEVVAGSELLPVAPAGDWQPCDVLLELTFRRCTAGGTAVRGGAGRVPGSQAAKARVLWVHENPEGMEVPLFVQPIEGEKGRQG